jgi:hypothetical protein
LKPDKITVAGIALALLTIWISGMLLIQSPFPIFNYAISSQPFISVTQDIGPKASLFMWTNRTLDLVAQAFVVFAAAMGCLAMLRVGEEKEGTDA